MLLMNITLNSCSPLRRVGGTTTAGDCANSRAQLGVNAVSLLSPHAGSAGWLATSSFPTGWVYGNGWMPPQTAGGDWAANLGPSTGLDGTSAMSTAIAGGKDTTVAIAGTGVLAPDGTTGLGWMGSTLAGTGSVVSDITAAVNLLVTIAGTGAMASVPISGAVLLEAALSGSGNITTAELAAVVDLLVTIAGTGSLSTNIAGGLYGETAIAGTGTVTTAGADAKGNMECTISLGGVSVSVDYGAIAQAVMDFAVETGYSMQDVLRILSAVAAGQTIIDTGPPVVVTFRDINDTTDRVVAEMTGSERVTVTLDPD